MRVLIKEKLSEHKYKTPEGYLICTDAILARTGKQTYRRDEIFHDSDDTEIEVDRTAEEVFSPQTLASFENKPITVEHPEEDVNSGNYKDYAVGFVRDVHQGKADGQDVILGTLVIQDAQTIEEIENGEHVELSCGYDCDIDDSENPQQRNIRGNHVALCECGRAGNARIVDSQKVKDIKYFAVSRYASEKYNNINSALSDLINFGEDDEVKLYSLKNEKDVQNLYSDDLIGVYKNGKLIEKGPAFTKRFNTDSVKDSFAILHPKYYEFLSTGGRSWVKEDSTNIQKFSTENEALEFGRKYVKGQFRLIKLVDSIEDADKFTFKLSKKKNDYDEYVIKAYKNGKYYEDASYYTDDWDDAVGTIKNIASRQGLTVKQQGSDYVADSKVKDGKYIVHFKHKNGGEDKDFVIEAKGMTEAVEIAKTYVSDYYYKYVNVKPYFGDSVKDADVNYKGYTLRYHEGYNMFINMRNYYEVYGPKGTLVGMQKDIDSAKRLVEERISKGQIVRDSQRFGITPRFKWLKGNKNPERTASSLEEARYIKSSCERVDGIRYIIFDLETYKVFDSYKDYQSTKESFERIEEMPRTARKWVGETSDKKAGLLAIENGIEDIINAAEPSIREELRRRGDKILRDIKIQFRIEDVKDEQFFAGIKESKLRQSKDFKLKELFEELDEVKKSPISIKKENDIYDIKLEIEKRVKQIKNLPNDILDEETPYEEVTKELEKNIEDAKKLYIIRWKDLFENNVYVTHVEASTMREAIEGLKKEVIKNGVGTDNVRVDQVQSKVGEDRKYHMIYGKIDDLLSKDINSFDSKCKDIFIKNKEGKYFFNKSGDKEYWYSNSLMATRYDTVEQAENVIQKFDLKNVEIIDSKKKAIDAFKMFKKYHKGK